MTDLRALVDFVAKMEGPHALVSGIDVSPAVMQRLRQSAALKTGAPDPFGLHLRENRGLIDRTALLRFADGRMGLWYMDTESIHVWNPHAI